MEAEIIYNLTKLNPQLFIENSFDAESWGIESQVLSPPPRCPNVDPYFLTKNFIAKIFKDNEFFKDEKRAQMIIKYEKLDPKRLFCVQMVAYCQIYKKKFDTKLTARTLGIPEHQAIRLPESDKIYYYETYNQIIYPLANNLKFFLKIAAEDINRCLATILFFMKSFGRFNDRGYHHDDFHGGNFMYSEKKGLLMAIDFSDIHEMIHHLRHVLDFQWPDAPTTFVSIEYRILYTLIKRARKGQSIEIKDIRNEEIDPTKKRHNFLHDIFDDKMRTQYVPYDYMITLFRLFCDRYSKSSTDSVESLMKKKPTKNDMLADTLFFGRHSRLFEELIPEVKTFIQTGNSSGILRLMDTPFVRKRFNSFALGHILFAFFSYFYQKLPNKRGILSIFLRVICNEMIQDDVYQRLSITEAFQKILSESRQNFPDFYAYYSEFDEHTESECKSPFGTMTEEEIEKEFEADRFLLHRKNRKTREKERHREERETANMQRENRRQRIMNQLQRHLQPPPQIIDCRGLPEAGCRARQDCLYVNKERKYCRKQGKSRRVLNLSLFPCRGKLEDACATIAGCLWRREGR
jgi:hypothetical protein